MGDEQLSLGSERAALDNFLDAQREGLLRKVTGMGDADARRAPTASALTLLGLLKHATVWERRWFQVVLLGRPSGEAWPDVRGGQEATFAVDERDTVADWVAAYREACEASRVAAAGVDLDERCVRTDLVDANLRYVLFHLVEETARHAGHADIIRETIDGSVGF